MNKPDNPGNRNHILFILFLWLICTGININKAFHIDDTFYLQAAQWIVQHPIQPMSGLINWKDVPEPIHHYNQPAGYMCLVALAGSVSGYHEIPMHLFQSFFTFLAILFFYKLCRRVCPQHVLFLTLLFGLCPAFLVNQNLMTDVPLVAFTLLFVYLILPPAEKCSPVRDAAAAAVLGAGLLIKYTLLPLVIVHLVSIVWRKQYRNLFSVLIPIGMIALWSWWNVAEFGYPHIFGRERMPFEFVDRLETFLSFMSCLGSVSPFAMAVFPGLFRKNRILSWFILGLFFVFCSFIVITWFGIVDHALSGEILRYLFIINGLALTGSVLFLSLKHFPFRRLRESFSHTELVLFFWFAGILSFLILYSPFVATRHVLLLVPPVLLISAKVFERIPFSLKLQAGITTVVLGILLGVSDWFYADFYRQTASAASKYLRSNERVWTAGHYGWQWYSVREGMREYEKGSPDMRSGDFLVTPYYHSGQTIDPGLVLQPVKKYWPEPGVLTFFSTGYRTCFYRSTLHLPAWQLSRVPFDTVVIYRVN